MPWDPVLFEWGLMLEGYKPVSWENLKAITNIVHFS